MLGKLHGEVMDSAPSKGHCHCLLWPEPMHNATAPAWEGVAVTRKPNSCLPAWASMGHECCYQQGQG